MCGSAGSETCANNASDNLNCGACGNTCGAGSACASGQCVTSCPSGQTMCGSAGNETCANLASDNVNCGACGNPCGAGSACVSGQCVTSSCPAGQTVCGGAGNETCANLASDPLNCGACGNACPTGSACFGGQCAGVCAPGQSVCGSTCRDLQADPNNCGACGNICATDLVCSAGKCTRVCDPGLLVCDDTCVDVTTNAAHCGGCGEACSAPNATMACVASTCELASCLPGFKDCNLDEGDGCEIDSRSDIENCGACDYTCSFSCNASACERRKYGSSVRQGKTDSFLTAGGMTGFKFNVPDRSRLLAFGFYPLTSNPRIRFSLYTDNAGVPGSLVAETDSTVVSSGTMEIPSLTRPMLDPGTYWIFAVASSDTWMTSGSSTTSYRYVTGRSPNNPSPATYPQPHSTQTLGFNINWYIVVE